MTAHRIAWTGENLPEVQAFCGQYRSVYGTIDLYSPRFIQLEGEGYLMGGVAPMLVPIGSEIVKDGSQLVVHEHV